MFINDGVFNNHVKDIQKHIPFVTASNSGNTYSIQIDDLDYLEDGQAIMVKFNAASTGAISVSVNGGTAKSVVDYFGNAVTNIRAGLIAHLVYSADDSNFQLQGKGGDGDALITDIRQGKKATTREGLITGVLPVQATAAQEVVPGTSDIVKPAGIYDGDITIKSIEAKAGDNELIILDNHPVYYGTTYSKMIEVQVNFHGTARVKFELVNHGYETAYGQIYINGQPIGIERTATDAIPTTYTEDISVKENDLIQIYGRVDSTGESIWCEIGKFSINLDYFFKAIINKG